MLSSLFSKTQKYAMISNGGYVHCSVLFLLIVSQVNSDAPPYAVTAIFSINSYNEGEVK